ncbi:MAG TPA: nucleoside deaminase [Clostridia bacterium]|nr:nucleoside deaminase [Clostridia bacterium]
MREALAEAEKAQAKGEVPIGAVLVKDGEVIASGHNLKETLQDPTAHAEMIAIREAAGKLRSWRLDDADLYVTIEPCPMCMGAMLQARVRRVIFGAFEPKAGAAGSTVDLSVIRQFNHRIEVIDGVLEDECRRLMQEFFQRRRKTE